MLEVIDLEIISPLVQQITLSCVSSSYQIQAIENIGHSYCVSSDLVVVFVSLISCSLIDHMDAAISVLLRSLGFSVFLE